LLIIKTYIDYSPEKGFGLFAKENIPKGTRYWVRNEFFDKVISSLELSFFDDIAIDFIKKYGFLEKSGNWYLCSDNARFSNHSENSNSENYFNSDGLVQYTYSKTRILAGEEILCNYRDICEECREKLKFKVNN